MARAIFIPVIPFLGVLIASACSKPSRPPTRPGDGTPTNPCAAVLCMAGTFCEAQPDGSARCVPQPSPGACFKTGCSGNVCADEAVVTTCEFRPEFVCYEN